MTTSGYVPGSGNPLTQKPGGWRHPKGRFIVFGTKKEGTADYVFVEIHTDDFDHAVEQRMIMSCADYKGRIFDTKYNKFVQDNVIDFAERKLNKPDPEAT